MCNGIDSEMIKNEKESLLHSKSLSNIDRSRQDFGDSSGTENR